jgi:hypothetical protein
VGAGIVAGIVIGLDISNRAVDYIIEGKYIVTKVVIGKYLDFTYLG